MEDIFIFSINFIHYTNTIQISNSDNKHKEITAGFTHGRRTQTGHRVIEKRTCCWHLLVYKVTEEV